VDEEHGSIYHQSESLSPKQNSYRDCEMPKHLSPRQAHLLHSELYQPDSYQHTPKLDSQQLCSQRFQENFLGWKSTFASIVKGLDLFAHKHIDLLTKWLGPELSHQACRMKAAKHPSTLGGS